MATATDMTAEDMALLIESLDQRRQMEVVQALICATPDEGRALVIDMLETWGEVDTRLCRKDRVETIGEWLDRSRRRHRRAALVRLAEYAALVAVIVTACVWAAIK